MKKFFLELPNAKNTKPPFMSINLRKVPVQNILNSSGAEILDKSKDQHRAAGHRRRIDVREGAYCGLEAPVGTLGDWRRQFSSRETGRGGTLNQPWSTSRYDHHHCALQVFFVIGKKFLSSMENFRISSGLYTLCVMSIFWSTAQSLLWSNFFWLPLLNPLILYIFASIFNVSTCVDPCTAKWLIFIEMDILWSTCFSNQASLVALCVIPALCIAEAQTG